MLNDQEAAIIRNDWETYDLKYIPKYDLRGKQEEGILLQAGELRLRMPLVDIVYSLMLIFCLFLARQPSVGQGLLILEVSISHTTTHHRRQDSSGRMISSSQRPLPLQHTILTTDRYPCPRWDSNPQSQQANGRRPMP